MSASCQVSRGEEKNVLPHNQGEEGAESKTTCADLRTAMKLKAALQSGIDLGGKTSCRQSLLLVDDDVGNSLHFCLLIATSSTCLTFGPLPAPRRNG